MTIGIAAYGPNAGLAVLEGVQVAEILGRGSIGGFAVFSVIDDRGSHHQFSCQEGGVSALRGADACLEARCAAIISSGPHRPEPLSQFLAGRSGLGLVSGHRLPNRTSMAGLPVNASALERIARGASPATSLKAEFDDNPELDFGLVAVTPDGRIGLGNSARVARRNDLIEAAHIEETFGYALLGNSIFFAPGRRPGEIIGDFVKARLSGGVSGCFVAELSQPVPVRRANSDRIELDRSACVTAIDRADPWFPERQALTTVIYSPSPVYQDGKIVGHCMSEVFGWLEAGNVTPDPASQSRFIVERA